MTITVVVRPSERTEVRNLPFTKGGAGYAILEEAIGASRRGQVKWEGGNVFSVARPHTQMLIEALAHRYGHVRVLQYGGATACVEACWDADPKTASECRCSCAGSNHGSRHPNGRVVRTDGPYGALSVSPDAPREYFYPPVH